MNQIEIKKRQLETAACVLEMVTLIILGNLLGDNGIVYLAAALESFRLFFTLTGARTADVLGKLLRGRSAKGQYKNAGKLRRNAMILEGMAGLAGSAALLAGAGFIGGTLLHIPCSEPIIRILAPVVFLRTLSSVLLGYFQGEGTELPTVITLAMRQIGILLFSLLFAGIFGGYGRKVSSLLREDDFTAMYGGMGVALAVLTAEAIVFLFLLLVYRGSRQREKRQTAEGMRTTDTFGSQAGVLYNGMMPLIAISILQRLPVWLGLVFFAKSAAGAERINDYGVLYGRYLPLAGILLLPVCAMLTGNIAKVAGCVRKEEQRYARENFSGGLHMAVIYGMFFSVFTAVFAQQFAEILCGTGAEAAVQMFRFGSFAILIFAAGFYFTEILLLLGGKVQVIGALALYNAVFLAGLLLLLNKGGAGIMSLIYAGLIAGAVYVLALGALLIWQVRLGIDWLQGIAVPAGASCVTGLLLLFVGKLITPHLGSLAATLICLLVGVVCYWTLLFLIRNFREQELAYIPGGNLIRRLGQMFRFF